MVYCTSRIYDWEIHLMIDDLLEELSKSNLLTTSFPLNLVSFIVINH